MESRLKHNTLVNSLKISQGTSVKGGRWALTSSEYSSTFKADLFNPSEQWRLHMMFTSISFLFTMLCKNYCYSEKSVFGTNANENGEYNRITHRC